MSKLTLLAAGAAGYVLGARAGRDRYEQIASTTRSVMRNPKVQSATQQAQETISQQASAAGSAVADKAKEAAGKVRSSDDSSGTGPTTPTAQQSTTTTTTSPYA
jgi:hypothetical protein